MNSLQRQARALGDPTRHEIFRYLAAAEGPVDVAALTAEFGLNHNSIRQHLSKLVEAGLLDEAKAARTSPGRPRLVYRLSAGAESRWGVVGLWELLSRALAQVIRTGKTPAEVGRAGGAQIQISASDPVTDIAAFMGRLGFRPDVDHRRSGVDIVLTACPFASIDDVDRNTLCSLHLGLVEGLTEKTAFRVDELLARPPRQAHCRVRLRPASEEPRPPARLVLAGVRTRPAVA